MLLSVLLHKMDISKLGIILRDSILFLFDTKNAISLYVEAYMQYSKSSFASGDYSSRIKLINPWKNRNQHHFLFYQKSHVTCSIQLHSNLQKNYHDYDLVMICVILNLNLILYAKEFFSLAFGVIVRHFYRRNKRSVVNFIRAYKCDYLFALS